MLFILEKTSPGMLKPFSSLKHLCVQIVYSVIQHQNKQIGNLLQITTVLYEVHLEFGCMNW